MHIDTADITMASCSDTTLLTWPMCAVSRRGCVGSVASACGGEPCTTPNPLMRARNCGVWGKLEGEWASIRNPLSTHLLTREELQRVQAAPHVALRLCAQQPQRAPLHRQVLRPAHLLTFNELSLGGNYKRSQAVDEQNQIPSFAHLFYAPPYYTEQLLWYRFSEGRGDRHTAGGGWIPR